MVKLKIIFYICNVIKKYKHILITNVYKCKDMKKIKPPTGSMKILIEEFKVTRTTIVQALAYYNNSVVAVAIRKRAIELLEAELKEIKEFEHQLKAE